MSCCVGGGRRWAIVLFAVVVWTSVACGPLVTHVTEAGVEPAVETSLEELTEPESKEKLNELLDLEGVESASERVGRGLARGMVSYVALTQPEMSEMNSDAQVEGFVSDMATQIEREVSPMLVDFAYSMTVAVTEAAASPENIERIAQLAADVTDSVVGAIAEGLRTEVGPAMAQILVEDVGPAISEMLDEDLNAALGNTAEAIAVQAAEGAMEGIMEPQQEEPSTIERLAGQVANIADSLGWVFWTLVAVFMAVFVGVVAWIVRLVFQSRDISKKSNMRDETLRLARALEEMDDDSAARQLLREIASDAIDDD